MNPKQANSRYGITWKSDPSYDCIVKLLVTPTPALQNFHRRMHQVRIAVNRIVWNKYIHGSGLPKNYSDLLNDPEIKEVCVDHGFNTTDHWRGIAYSVYDPYKAYMKRNKKSKKDRKDENDKYEIPARPINLKEYGALRFKATNGFMRDLNPTESKGELEFLIAGHWKQNPEVIRLAYEIPEGMKHLKQYVIKNPGLNIKPPLQDQDWRWWVFGLRAEPHFTWDYSPVDSIGFDINLRPEAFIVFSNNVDIEEVAGNKLARPDDIYALVEYIGELNDKIENKDKATKLTTKERRIYRLAWHKAQDELKYALVPYANRIVEFAHNNKLLLCIDDVTSGATNGEFGQMLHKLIITRAIRTRTPFIPVPTPYTSQRCSSCGYTSPNSRDKKELAKFKCVHCNTEMDADWNGACNIKTFGSYIWENGLEDFSDSRKSQLHGKFLFVPQVSYAF